MNAISKSYGSVFRKLRNLDEQSKKADLINALKFVYPLPIQMARASVQMAWHVGRLLGLIKKSMPGNYGRWLQDNHYSKDISARYMKLYNSYQESQLDDFENVHQALKAIKQDVQLPAHAKKTQSRTAKLLEENRRFEIDATALLEDENKQLKASYLAAVAGHEDDAEIRLDMEAEAERAIPEAIRSKENIISKQAQIIEDLKHELSWSTSIKKALERKGEVIGQRLRGEALTITELLEHYEGLEGEKNHQARAGSTGDCDDEWYTPPAIVEACRQAMGSIDLDPSSCDHANKVVQANKYHTLEDDGLKQDWHGNVFLNPPYSKTGGKREFITKAVDEYRAGNITACCLILSYDFSASWFEPLRQVYAAIALMRGRVQFYKEEPGDRRNPSLGTAVVFLGENVLGFANSFHALADVVQPLDGTGGLVKKPQTESHG